MVCAGCGALGTRIERCDVEGLPVTTSDEHRRHEEQQEVQRAIATSDLYNVLSLLLQYPAGEVLDGLSDGALAADVGTIIAEAGLADERTEAASAELAEIQRALSEGRSSATDIRCEYTRLFNHPDAPAIPIYEGLFLHAKNRAAGKRQVPPLRAVNPEAMDAERCYRQARKKHPLEGNEPADHMATEMAFMQYLYVRKADALSRSDDAAAEVIDGQIEEFSRAHLKKWAVDFFDACVALSRNGVYRAVGLLGGMLMSEMPELDRVE